jgi:Glyoxalase-like domain
MARLADIVIDCAAPAALARFWAAALDGYAIAPYDEAELARLRAAGIDDLEDDPTVLVEAADGPRLWLVRVPEPKTVKNRVHIDLRADDASAETARLVSLGAIVAPEQRNDRLIVLLDPEGNEFCLLKV